jgi:2-polyprenyl-3-methyl-5-hydroxy-6-metoxy-1,4-benzoquinol methylase
MERQQAQIDSITGQLQEADGYRVAQVQQMERQQAQIDSITGQLQEVDGYRVARVQQMERQQRLTTQFVSSVCALLERVDTAQSDIAQLSARCAAIEARGVSSTELHQAVKTEIAGLRERQDSLSRIVSERSQALSAVMRELSSDLPPAEVSLVAPGRAPGRQLDQLYLQFEDLARGTRETIKQRQSVYLPLVREVGAGTPERPILDVGAGRGEWLELLHEQGLTASGIDLNRSMVSLCQTLGIDCIEGEAVAHLRTLPSNSHGLVSGFHIIEHLPFDVFIDLLDEALRVLAPGGTILFETPDPENVLVGSHTFYMDPTHRNPMPSGMTAIMARARGLTQVEVRRLHPSTDHFSGQEGELIDRLNALFFGPQDYALIGRKP